VAEIIPRPQISATRVAEAIVIALLVGAVVVGINRIWLLPELAAEIRAVQRDMDRLQRSVEYLGQRLDRVLVPQMQAPRDPVTPAAMRTPAPPPLPLPQQPTPPAIGIERRWSIVVVIDSHYTARPVLLEVLQWA